MVVENQNVARQNGEQQHPQQQQPPQPGLIETFVQIFVMICVFQVASKAGYSFFGLNNDSLQNSTTSSVTTSDNVQDNVSTKRKPAGVDQIESNGESKASIFTQKNHVLLWPYESKMNLNVIVNEKSSITLNEYYKIKSKDGKTSKTIAYWEEENLIFSKGKADVNTRNKNVTIPITQSFWNNQTALYAHVYLTRIEDPAALKESSLSKERNLLYKTFNLTSYKIRKKERYERSLMEDESDPGNEARKLADMNISPNDNSVLGLAAKKLGEDVVLMYIKPSLTLQLVEDIPPHFPKKGLPEQMKRMLDFYNEKDDGTQQQENSKYYPVLSNSEFWLRNDDLLPVNETLKVINLQMSIYPLKMWKWQLMSQMEETWKIQDETGQSDGASDVMRTVLMDTNPWLLGITFVVSILHTIFDMLAFKNDISFFKDKKSMEGISLRSMIVNTGFQVIILLYLFDNDTSFMVLVSNAIGVAIEFWKISKAIKVSISDGKIKWEEDKTYKQTKTKEYDEIATNHLLFVTMPLVAGYGIYSLFHQKHKGWYSWILNTMVGFIYMFGFVMMTPQLFINYKLQSVAHLNWRTMTYKSINTFIDDLFAFIIKMPIMHRLACLRDDLIFFIFLYQRYAYRVDYTRVNEFGQCSAPTEELLLAEQDKKKNSSDAIVSSTATTTTRNTKKRRGARDKRD